MMLPATYQTKQYIAINIKGREDFMANIYSSRELPGYESPAKGIVKSNISGGAALLFVSGLVILLHLGNLRKTLAKTIDFVSEFTQAKGQSIDVELSAAAVMTYVTQISVLIYFFVFAVFLIKAIKFGFGHLIQGVFQRFDKASASNIPYHFANDDAVAELMVDKTTVINAEMDDLTKTVFGNNIRFLSPVAGQVARPVILRLKSTLILVLKTLFKIAILVGATVFLASLLPEEALAERGLIALREGLETGALTAILWIPVILIILIAVIGIFTDTVFMRLITPRGEPDTDSRHLSEPMSANMAPYMILNRLPNQLTALEWMDFANRVSKFDGELASTVVADSGKFETQLLIERQPEPIASPNQNAASFWMLVGWVEVIMSVILFSIFIMPSPLKQAVIGVEPMSASSFLLPIGLIALMIILSRLMLSGMSKIKSATLLFRAHWFKAPAVFVRLRGTIDKSRIVIGDGQDDSIKTETNLLRSDFLAEIWSSELVSEWLEGHSNGKAPQSDMTHDDETAGKANTSNKKSKRTQHFRHVIALQNTTDSRDWLNFTSERLKLIGDERAKPTGVDLGNSETGDIVDANLTVQQARNNAKADVKLEDGQKKPFQNLPDNED